MFGIALNKCRAELRKRAAKANVLEYRPEAAALDDAPSPEQCAVNAETASIVTAAIHRLPTAQKTVVVLRVYNGLSYRDIAKIVKRTEGTVRSHMFHALGTMRKYLEPRLKKDDSV